MAGCRFAAPLSSTLFPRRPVYGTLLLIDTIQSFRQYFTYNSSGDTKHL